MEQSASMKAVDLAKSLYRTDAVKIILLMVREDVEHLYSEKELKKAKDPLESTLEAVADHLNGYDVKKGSVRTRRRSHFSLCRAEQYRYYHHDEIDQDGVVSENWFCRGIRCQIRQMHCHDCSRKSHE